MYANKCCFIFKNIFFKSRCPKTNKFKQSVSSDKLSSKYIDAKISTENVVINIKNCIKWRYISASNQNTVEAYKNFIKQCRSTNNKY